MTLTNIICITLCAIFLVVGVVLFLLSHRESSSRQPLDNRTRAVLDDRGDRIIWETGESWPLINAPNSSKMTRRMFIPKAATGIAAVFAGWRLAIRSASAKSLQDVARTGTADASGTPEGVGPDSHRGDTSPYQVQDDTHNDFETHGDSLIQHQDVTNARGIHFDVPHYDADTGHFDIHNDS